MGSGFEDVGGGGDGTGVKPPIRKRSEAIRQPGLAKAPVVPLEEIGRAVPQAEGSSRAVTPAAVRARMNEKGGTIKEVSAALESEMLIARVQELGALEERAVENARGMGKKLQFDVVQRKRDDSALRPDMERIIETIWIEDVHATWTKLKKALRLGTLRKNHQAVARALDEAQQNAYEATCLLITTKREKERWELANAGVQAAMWSAANRVLQSEKEAGIRAKQITDADVKAMATTLFPDEWAAYHQKLREIELMVSALGDFATMTAKRAENLSTMHSKMRG